ncbi:MAG: ATP-binding protein, partial [Angustibacter sp.]
MDPVKNPYTPNAGAKPQVIVGRSDQLASFDLLLRRIQLGKTEQSMIITGLRGVGKTVLLGQFRTKALTSDWVVVELEVSKHDDDQFRRLLGRRLRSALLELSPKARWGTRMKRAAAALASFTVTVDGQGNLQASMLAEPVEGVADHGDLALDLSELLIEIGEAARDCGRGVVLLLDEVQFLRASQLEAVIGAIHRLVQRSLPVTMVGAGLPQIAELAGDAKSYAERLFTFPPITGLNDEDTRRALSEPALQENVRFSRSALDRAVEITGGYPYFIQELGHAVWSIARGDQIQVDDVEAASAVYESKLDTSFFRVRLDRATEAQRAYLRAMA